MRFAVRFVQLGLVVILMTSGIMVSQAAQPMPTDGEGRPLYQADFVVVKLKSEPAQFVGKALPHRFGVSSLD